MSGPMKPEEHRILRAWTREPALYWHDNGAGTWRGSWNNIEIGLYNAEPSPHWEGCYVAFGATKFTTVIRTAAEARAAIEAKFQEWLSVAFDVRKVTPAGDDGLRAAIAACTYCRGRGYTFSQQGDHLDCPLCRDLRKELERSAPTAPESA